MSFAALMVLQDKLDRELIDGSISFVEHEREWAEILIVAGWSSEDYELQIDRRWDTSDDAPPDQGPSS